MPLSQQSPTDELPTFDVDYGTYSISLLTTHSMSNIHTSGLQTHYGPSDCCGGHQVRKSS